MLIVDNKVCFAW